jgi:hypothetical protein
MRHAHTNENPTVTLQHSAHWQLDGAAAGVLNKDAGEPKTRTNPITQHLTLSVCDAHTLLI